ncbi:MAG TPA: glutathione S-transferase family protein [Candidatus Binataceae bacterium]|nr:glutathione S-transferase family protein [Candidatus Binataceae bacterium]
MKGQLVHGKWVSDAAMLAMVDGRFVRENAQFRNWITADGSSGFPAEKGRYHLYVSLQCPWAWRTVLYRSLKKLHDVISMTVAIPNDRREGWIFGEFPGCTPDTANGFTHLHRVYAAANPDYTGTVTVPVLWDKQERTIVNNESPEIIRMLNREFDAFTTAKQDYYPEPLRGEIDALNDRIYRTVNNGVYRAGFATTQEAYDEAYDELFGTLDWIEERLGRERYLAGGTLTEADWRLLATLLRFDPVYNPLMRCNQRTIASYPNLSNYTRELYQVPGVAQTFDIRHIITGYYSLSLNPMRAIPKGPKFFRQWLESPHDRDRLRKD